MALIYLIKTVVYIEKRQLPSEELNGQSGHNPSSNRQEHSNPTIPTIQLPRESPVGYKSRRRGGVPLPCVLAWIEFFRNLRHEPAARKPFYDFGKCACQRDTSQVRLNFLRRKKGEGG